MLNVQWLLSLSWACFASHCGMHFFDGLVGRGRFSLYEPVEFIRHFLMDRLEWRKVRCPTRPPCSQLKHCSGFPPAPADLWACAWRCDVHVERLLYDCENRFY